MRSLTQHWGNLLDEHRRLDRIVAKVHAWLPPLNYIVVHYLYFILTCLLSSIVFWGSSRPFRSISYVDSLFLVTSAMTNTGLNTINVSDATTWQQVMLTLLMIVGSPIWVAFWTVMARKHVFERRFEDIVEADREMRKRAASAATSRAPTLRQALGFRSFKTEPKSGIPLDGLTPRQAATVPLDHAVSDRRALSTPPAPPAAATLPISPGDARSKLAGSDSTMSAAGGETAELPREHIAFADSSSRPSDRDASVYQPRPDPTPRHDTPSPETSPIESTAPVDLLYNWSKILGKHRVGRNGQFYGLSVEERDRIGGLEYRALKILAWTVFLYGFLWQFIGAIALGAWTAHHAADVLESFGANPWWGGIFNALSAFNNAGLSLVDTSMIPFQRSWFVLIAVGALILAGNAAFPIMLRLILWLTIQLLKLAAPAEYHGPWRETLEFILKYPRRVFTTLFPARITWWLLAMLLLITCTDWVAFEVMNVGNPLIESLPVGQRIMAGLFQAVALRTAGYVVIPLTSLNIDLQMLYLIMMYIAIYPVVISMRNSNVYEERSLGIYQGNPDAKAQDQGPALPISGQKPTEAQFLRRRSTAAVLSKRMKSTMTFQGVGARQPAKSEDDDGDGVSFVEHQIRGQLAHDLWWLVFAILVITILETGHFSNDPITFSVFNIAFETVSGYGGIGLSTGLPNNAYSFSGAWHKASQLILCAVMLRGRHRGLPVALDRAVRLPGEKMAKDEDEDYRIKRAMTMSRLDTMSRVNTMARVVE